MKTLKTHSEVVDLQPEGLGSCCHPKIHRLGRRGSRVVYQAYQDELQNTVDPESGLSLFAIDEVFLDKNSVLVGCGNPNAAIAMYRNSGPRGAGWYKLAAFMFWRQDAFVAPAKGRLQSGLYMELRNLPSEAREGLWRAMLDQSGKRGPSCAKINADALAKAGFELGNGRAINKAIRPSKYTSLLWRFGIRFRSNPVDVRIVLTGDKGVGDHMKAAWLKEVSAPGRTIRKVYASKDAHQAAPVFIERVTENVDSTKWTGKPVSIGVNRPSRLGANLTFLFGQQPVYTVKLERLGGVDAISQPLQPFPGKLDRMTKVKRYVLFSRPVIALIRSMRHKWVDIFDGVPAGAAFDMLTPSPSADHSTAVLYNCVVTVNTDGNGEARITPLKNQDPISQNDKVVKTVNWILAKHVLISGYDPNTVSACELWCYRDETGQLVVCFNDNSGTYKPDENRGKALEVFLTKSLGLPVRYCPMNWDEV